jgi:predicted Rossmann-fold nucleotide-binding protein
MAAKQPVVRVVLRSFPNKKTRRVQVKTATIAYDPSRKEDRYAAAVFEQIVTGKRILRASGVPLLGIFGPARGPLQDLRQHPAYHIARIGVETGYVIVNGAGPYAMKASSMGAMEAGGVNVGIHYVGEKRETGTNFEQQPNEYVTETILCSTGIARFEHVVCETDVVVATDDYGFGTLHEILQAIVCQRFGEMPPEEILLWGNDWSDLLQLARGRANRGLFPKEEVDRLRPVIDFDELRRILAEKRPKYLERRQRLAAGVRTGSGPVQNC